MKPILIPPFSLCDRPPPADMHLLLPECFRNESYAANVYIAKDRGDYLILDNGAAEGHETHPDILHAMGHEYQVDEVVVPDTMGDMSATMAQMDNFQPQAQFKYMVVLQGKTLEEAVMVARHAMVHHSSWVTCLGIPRHLAQTTSRRDIRLWVVGAIETALHWHEVEIHFLGTTPLWPEEVKFANIALRDRIRSVDTSLPFNYTVAGVKLQRDGEAPCVKRPNGYFYMPEAFFDEGLLKHNIDTFVRWATYDN